MLCIPLTSNVVTSDEIGMLNNEIGRDLNGVKRFSVTSPDSFYDVIHEIFWYVKKKALQTTHFHTWKNTVQMRYIGVI